MNNNSIFVEPKELNSNSVQFKDLYKAQMLNQQYMLTKGLYEGFSENDVFDRLKDVPLDSPKLASYHIQQLISEVGEVLESDKRWKNFRNKKYNVNKKLEEIVDCFIVMMNISIFSGFSAEQLTEGIINKLKVVAERIEKE